MKLSAKRGLYTGRRITLLASVVCISLAVTGCKEESAAIAQVNAISVDQSGMTTTATEVVSAVEKVAVKTETNADKIAKEVAQRAMYAKEQAKRFTESDTDIQGVGAAGVKRINISDVYVVDGDTIHGTDSASGEKLKVRMTGIDAPEKGQALSDESADALRNCIGGEKTAVLVIQSNNEKDKYGRVLASVEAQGINCNQQQVEKGMAWYYEDFADKITNGDNRMYNEAHHYAQDNALGVWQLPLGTKKPWEYRAENK